MTYDVIIVAGNKNSSYSIKGQNKALLTIKGIPLIVYILKTLEKARVVNRVYIVGPKKELQAAVDTFVPHLKEGKIGAILEQKNTIYENFWNAYNYTFNDGKEGIISRKSESYKEKIVLVMPGDIPLITPGEIEYFISECDTERYDYFLGLTPEDDLNHFYPSDRSPGIKMAYVHFKDGLYRGNNLHFLRPGRIENAPFTQTVYNLRYQKKLKNIMQAIIEVSKLNAGYIWIWYYFLMQTSQLLSSIGLGTLSYIPRRFVSIDDAEQCVSRFLKTRFKAIRVPYAGAALDIDNETHFEAMSAMFDKWKNYLLS